jgi:hypothetical protein
MSNNLLTRYSLSGCSFSAEHWLKFNHQNNNIPKWVQEKLKDQDYQLEHLATLVRYQKSLLHRKPIFINTKAIDILLEQAEVSEQHQSILKSLLKAVIEQKSTLYEHSPVLPFSTTVITAGAKTGRDTTKGASIQGLPKKYWEAILKPPLGFSYVLFDYVTQEPAIVAAKSGAKDIQNMYIKGDLYDALNQKVTEGHLERKQFKSLFIKHLYGQRADAIAEGLQLHKAQVQVWIARLKTIIQLLNKFLDMQLYQAKKAGEVRSKDWRMLIGKDCTDLSIRNWPVQACGADIMRRACLALEKAGLPVLLTNHDSFLIQIKTTDIDQQSALAYRILSDISAEVLDGFKLKVKTELVINNQIEENEHE